MSAPQRLRACRSLRGWRRRATTGVTARWTAAGACLDLPDSVAVTTPTGPLPAAVLWDLDGTLVNTEPYWIAAETALAERDGGTWTHEDGLTLVGQSLPYAARQLRRRGGVRGTDDEIVADMLELVVRQVRDLGVPWRPGARELLEALGEAAVPCAMVTMAYASLAEAVADAAPAGSFREVISGDQVRRGKPHPEPYRLAAGRLGVPATACVAIEDSPPGVASAEAAGCRVVAVPLFVQIPAAPGRSRIAELDQFSLADLRRVMAGEVIDLL